MDPDREDKGLKWQVGVWDSLSNVYLREIDRRFVPVVEGVIARASLGAGERVLDLGTGTGSVALAAASIVGDQGRVVGTDLSPDMLRLAKRRSTEADLANLEFREGPAEHIPTEDATFDVVLASLSLMYVIDRAAAAREIRRVLKPGGRFVAAVWASPDDCDIVRFQETAGSFGRPPVSGVGPGAMADPGEFLAHLSEAGIPAHVDTQELGFEFDDFESAWNVLAGVTTANLEPSMRERAKSAVRELMWTHSAEPRRFRNLTQFIIGRSGSSGELST